MFRLITLFVATHVVIGQNFENVITTRPEVITSVGKIAGYLKIAAEGTIYSAFEGIPYAKPPIGDLRFEAPQAAEPWTGTWNATTLHECIQLSLATSITGQEDCLYLNVYVPREQPLSIETMDVIAHIHGGGFMTGSPFSYTLPDYLMDRNVIFVTFTYRLGVLGFLSTGDEVVPGNNGLKDQQLALKWIQENIEYFGGNPNSVTLTGFSAGAASSHLHYLSPTSKGLFKRGVSHSGSAVNAWALQEDPLSMAQSLSSELGCSTESNVEMVKCLKERPAKQILSKTIKADIIPSLHFVPVVDGDFLPKSAIEILISGEVPDIPWIFSNTAQDGLFPGFLLAEHLETLDQNWNYASRELLQFHSKYSQEKWNEIASAIKEHYLGKNTKFSLDKWQDFVKLITERFFTVDIERAAKLQAKHSKSSVYYYYYNYKSDSTFSDLVAPHLPQELKAIGHGDDILQLYGNVLPNHKLTEDDIKIKNIMLDLLTSFASTSKPKVSGVTWNPTESEELTYLNITSPYEISVLTQSTISQIDFWNQYDPTEKIVMKDEL
ncbi:venom carboxylesterase-6 [Aethina tumida]|uniref:venom carboxylesterase-6 n=1 Tax=Aethina tumida TaxID=116153 RepID=UPI002148261F|nr:venom carboxylesterase-6 [Aethina tumida]